MADPAAVTAEFFPVAEKKPLRFRPRLGWAHEGARYYDPAPGLKEALEVAMAVGQPLLLTGGPGAGKTQAAYWLAEQLGAGEVLRFDVKSTTLGTDLLYTFDELGRYRDATTEAGAKPMIEYIRFNALGEAILRAMGSDAVLKTMAGEVSLTQKELQAHADRYGGLFGGDWIRKEARAGLTVAQLMRLTGPVEREPVSRVVLIDELDKAPRDTPNDLLAEVETMGFDIPELRLRVSAPRPTDDDRRSGTPEARPVVIITSNAEKPLPEPFTRRCAFMTVPPLTGAQLATVLEKALFGQMTPENRARLDAGDGAGEIAKQVAAAAESIRSAVPALRRSPGTSEVLSWAVSALHLAGTTPFRAWIQGEGNRAAVLQSLRTLLKYEEDQIAGLRQLVAWASPPSEGRSA